MLKLKNTDKNTDTGLFHAPKTILVSKILIWPTKIFFWFVAAYFFIGSYSGYLEETIFIHRDNWSKSEDPFIYWFTVIGYVVVAIGSIWQSFRVKIKM